MNETAPTPRRLLDFRSGGWVLLLALVCTAVTAAIMLVTLFSQRGRPGVGDGENVSTYGFDLASFRGAREYLVASGFPKDGLPRWRDRVIADANDVARINTELREAHVGKALTETDLVIGVVHNGAARAWPLRFLTLHEICEDELGGLPLLVTYNPLCDSTAVYDRRRAGDTQSFGVSGLLYCSNALLYDHQDDPNRESLWSQLAGRALSGPAVGAQLTHVAHQVVPWGAWLARYPQSEVVLPRCADYKIYKRISYNKYHSLQTPQFPVPPVRTPMNREPFDLVIGLQHEGMWRAVFMPPLLDRPATYPLRDPNAVLAPLTRDAVWLDPAVPQVRAAWFAWHAQFPDTSPGELIAAP